MPGVLVGGSPIFLKFMWGPCVLVGNLIFMIINVPHSMKLAPPCDKICSFHPHGRCSLMFVVIVSSGIKISSFSELRVRHHGILLFPVWAAALPPPLV